MDPTPSPAIESISAVTLATADLDTAIAFYLALGFEPVSGGTTAGFATFGVGTGFLNLQLDPEHAPLASIWGRAIFHVSDVDAMYERVVSAGIRPLTEPWDAPWGERYFHVRDPDGHELSFARPIGP
jgi:catechol 2,3-dioxygenase-like lactoylglutathione lyase family enzyme